MKRHVKTTDVMRVNRNKCQLQKCCACFIYIIVIHSAIVKAGVGAKGDATRLFKDYKLTVNGLASVDEMARSMEPQAQGQKYSLVALTRRYVDGALLGKPASEQFGRWSSLPLPEPMQIYAATDAAAGRDIFVNLQRLSGMYFAA